MHKILKCLTVATVLAAIGITTAGAGDWPEKPITVVVPFRAGGYSDVSARKLEPGLKSELGQSIVVLNIAGHSSVGTRRVIDAKPDGYEFLFHETGMMTAEASGAQDFGHRQLKPVAAIGEVCLVVVGRGNAGWTSVSEIGKASGDKELIAGVTIGGSSHMAVMKAAEIGGFKIPVVQVGGSADAYAALIGEQIDLMVTVPSSASSYYYNKDGSKMDNPEAIPLLYLGADSHPSIPETQGMSVAGSNETLCIPSLFFAPKGTPDDIVSIMASALKVAYYQKDGLNDFSKGIGGVDLFVSGDALPGFIDKHWSILEPLASSVKR